MEGEPTARRSHQGWPLASSQPSSPEGFDVHRAPKGSSQWLLEQAGREAAYLYNKFLLIKHSIGGQALDLKESTSIKVSST